MLKLPFLLLLLALTSNIAGQNLVPNPSFENIQNVEPRWSGTFSHFNRNMNLWTSPTQGSPDLILEEFKDKMIPARPKNDLSNIAPRTGELMTGIKTFGCEAGNLHCKEYLQIKLSQSLVAGEKYYFEYYVNPLPASIKTGNFGAALSDKFVQEIMVSGLLPSNNFVAIPDIKKEGWQKVSGIIEAKTNAQYLLIGNFTPDSETPFVEEKEGLTYSFYLIDDVFLKPVKKTTERPFVLSDLAFEVNSYQLKEASKKTLNLLLQDLTTYPEKKIKIEGHTSDEGSDDRNAELSRQRAKAVADYLTKNGLKAARIISIVGRGSEKPAAPNDSEINRAKNRRVEVFFF